MNRGARIYLLLVSGLVGFGIGGLPELWFRGGVAFLTGAGIAWITDLTYRVRDVHDRYEDKAAELDGLKTNLEQRGLVYDPYPGEWL